MPYKPREFQVVPLKHWEDESDKRRPRACEYKEECLPLSVRAYRLEPPGWCVGLRHKSKDLDCLTICHARQTDSSKYQWLPIFIKPDEVADLINSLIHGIECVFWCNPQYQADSGRLHRANIQRRYRGKKAKEHETKEVE